jgi:hypothetical protein
MNDRNDYSRRKRVRDFERSIRREHAAWLVEHGPEI